MSNNDSGNNDSGSGSTQLALLQKLVVNSSALLGRMSWLTQAGLTHSGSRDLWSVFGYERVLTPEKLYLKYRRQDIAKTIVEFPADALWTRPPVVKTNNAEFMTAWKDLCAMHPIWDVCRRADYCTGFGRYSVILIGLADGSSLEAPIKARGNARKPGELLYLQPYSEIGVKILENETDASSPRFGKPKFYQIQQTATEFGTPGNMPLLNTVQLAGQRVHYSRIIHIADNVLEDETCGIPRLEPVYNLLDDLLKAAGGTAEAYWLTANRGMQIDVDKDMQLSADDLSDLSDEIDDYVHNLRRFIRTRGVKVTELGSRVPSVAETVNTITSLIAATARIPQKILFGSEVGQLASTQDRANWAERVGERRKKVGEPRVLGPLIARFSAIGFLPVPVGLHYDWPEAFILGPLERAQTAAQKARSAANLSKVLSEHGENLLTRQEMRNIIGMLDETEILEGNSNDPIVA